MVYPFSETPLTLKLRVHLVGISVLRAIDDLTRIVNDINAHWSLAGIQFALEGTPDEISIKNWDHWPNPTVNDRTTLVPTDGAIHGYYGYWPPDPPDLTNGFSYLEPMPPFPQIPYYFVRDHRIEYSSDNSLLMEWTPNLARVSSHEIGHILGLAHYEEQGYLMTKGGCDVGFKASEIIEVNNSARRILNH